MAESFARGEIGEPDAELAAGMALGAVVQPAVFKLYGRLPGPLAARAKALTRAALGAVGARQWQEGTIPQTGGSSLPLPK